MRMALEIAKISIHALRAERDVKRHFNPRAPSGARLYNLYTCNCNKHFNPRAPSGARHKTFENAHRETDISIHALRAERDMIMKV